MTLRKCAACATVLALCLCMTACNNTLISPDAKPTTTTTKPASTTSTTVTTTTEGTTTTTTTDAAVDDPDVSEPSKDVVVQENNVEETEQPLAK